MSDTQEKNLDYEAEGGSVVDVHDAVRREKILPPTGQEPVSFSPIIATIIVIILGAGYFGAYGNFFRDDIYISSFYQPEPRPAGIGGDEGGDKGPWIDQWLAGGKRVYGQCAACHQPNGGGLPGQYPPLTGSEWVHGGTERLGAILLHGIQGPLTVAGQSYGTIPMPPWNALSDEQIAQVITYVRSEFGEMKDDPKAIVTTEMIGAARDKFSGKAGSWTESELLDIPADAMLPGAEVDPQTGQPVGGGEDAAAQ
ncbi:MAG: cytochrome c [Verrucomicrobiae bacterium]|nr:cytochrome c [Verrucomicrobiae bacterium]